MKNKFANIFLLSSLISYVAIAVVAVLVANEFNFFNASFFICLGALILPNIPICIIIRNRFKNILKSDIVTLPNLIIAFIVANVLLFISGIVCTCLDNLTLTISITIVIYAVYIIFVMQHLAIGLFITKNDEYRAKKVLFKRALTDLIKGYSYVAKDVSLKSELTKLSNNLRFSDPMSSDALKADEQEILDKATELKQYINTNDEQAKTLINEIDLLLKLRNDKCARLK